MFSWINKRGRRHQHTGQAMIVNTIIYIKEPVLIATKINVFNYILSTHWVGCDHVCNDLYQETFLIAETLFQQPKLMFPVTKRMIIVC